MFIGKYQRASAIQLILLASVLYFPSANCEPVALDETNLHWSKLEFKAYLILVPLTADVEFTKVNSSDAVSGFYNPADKPLIAPAGDELLLLTMNSDNFGRKSNVRFWFEPNLTGLETEQIDTGRKNYVRAYRFGQNGVYRRDIFPTKQEEDLPRNKWTKLEHHEYPHPPDFQSKQLTDSAALFYIVSAANLNKSGDTFTFYTFGKKHLSKIELKVEGTSDIDVDYYEHGTESKRRVEDTVNALRISITATPVGADIKENEFEFLGLKEDIKIYLDPRYRIPLQISSRIKIIGSVNIRLNHAYLK